MAFSGSLWAICRGLGDASTIQHEGFEPHETILESYQYFNILTCFSKAPAKPSLTRFVSNSMFDIARMA